jgi:hypothetical protein
MDAFGLIKMLHPLCAGEMILARQVARGERCETGAALGIGLVGPEAHLAELKGLDIF